MVSAPVDAGPNGQQPRLELSNEGLAGLLGHLLVAGMILCFSVILRLFLSRVFPDWLNGYLVPLTVLVGVEAMISRRFLIRRLGVLDVEWYLIRGAEWVVLLVSLRLLIYALRGVGRLAADVAEFGYNFLGYFQEPEFFWAAFAMFLGWWLGTAFTQDLLDQEGDQLLDDRQTIRMAIEDRELARRRLLARTFIVGTVLVAVHALTLAELAFIWRGRPPPGSAGVFILAFFALGLVLFSLSQFSSLRALWRAEGLTVNADLAARWGGYVLLFLLVLMVVIGVLPTSYGLGFLDLLRRLVGWVLGLLFWVAQVLWALVILGIAVLGSWLSGEAPPPVDGAPLPPPPALPPSSAGLPTETTPPLVEALEALQALLFWFLFLVVVYYAFGILIGRYRELFERLAGLPLVSFLTGIWRRIQAALGRAGAEVRRGLHRGIQRLKDVSQVPRVTGPVRFFHPGRLPPRQRVRFYFLVLARRGRDLGVARKPSQTPFEYVEELRHLAPEAEDALAELRDAFIESRYTRHPVAEEQAGRARRLWLRVRRLLKKSS